MTAMLKINQIQGENKDGASMMDGDVTEMFSSGSAPITSARAMMGEGVQMFSTSCQASGADTATGEGVQMFSTSCQASGADTATGEGVQMFSTSCEKVGAVAVKLGEGTRMFSSGS
ncbi:hypothetical protein KBY23_03695 [Ruegeria pomeroyi]|nr:hypothetical protein [Ruegeria pomeroyi]